MLLKKFHKKVGDNGAYWAAHGSAKTLSVYATAKFKISSSEYETNSHQKSISQHAGSDGHSDEVSRRSETKY